MKTLVAELPLAAWALLLKIGLLVIIVVLPTVMIAATVLTLAPWATQQLGMFLFVVHNA